MQAYLFTEKARELLGKGEYAAAENCLREAIKIDPDDMAALFELGKVFYLQHRYDDAERTLASLHQNHKDNVDISMLLAKTYRAAGKLEEAASIYESLLDKDGLVRNVHRELACIYHSMRKLPQAAAMYKVACQENVGHGAVVLEYARLLADVGKYGEALEEMKKLESEGYETAQLYMEMARIHNAKKEYRAAVEVLEKAANGRCFDRRMHFEMGRNYHALGECLRAEQELKKYLEYCPDDAEARLELGLLYRVEERLDEAFGVVKKLESEGYETAQLYMEMARIHNAKKEYRAAVEVLEKAANGRCFDRQMHFEMGRNYHALGECLRAEQELKKYLEYCPDDAEARVELGCVYKDRGDCAHALEELRKAIEQAEAGDYRELVTELAEGNNPRIAVEMLLDYRREKHRLGNAFVSNKIMASREILKKKIRVESLPLKLDVVLTGKCNLDCIMCCQKRSDWEIPDHTVKEIIELMPYLEIVQWQGGEVFLSEHFEELYDRASDFPDLIQCITTNGTMIDEKWAQRFAKSGAVLDLSIDGLTKKTYEYVRRGADFEGIISTLELLRECREKIIPLYRKMRTTIHFVVMKSNYQELDGIIDFAYRYGIDKILLDKAVDFNPSQLFEKECLDNDPLIRKRIAQMLPEITNKGQSLGITVESWISRISHPFDGEGFQKNDGDMPGNAASPSREMIRCATSPCCCVPWRELVIFVEGEVKPHCACCEDIGNVTNDSLMNIWNGQKMQEYRRRLVNGEWKGLCNPRCYFMT